MGERRYVHAPRKFPAWAGFASSSSSPPSLHHKGLQSSRTYLAPQLFIRRGMGTFINCQPIKKPLQLLHHLKFIEALVSNPLSATECLQLSWNNTANYATNIYICLQAGWSAIPLALAERFAQLACTASCSLLSPQPTRSPRSAPAWARPAGWVPMGAGPAPTCQDGRQRARSGCATAQLPLVFKTSMFLFSLSDLRGVLKCAWPAAEKKFLRRDEVMYENNAGSYPKYPEEITRT